MSTPDPKIQRPVHVQHAVYALAIFIVFYAANQIIFGFKFLFTSGQAENIFALVMLGASTWVMPVLFYILLTVKVYRGYRWAQILLYLAFVFGIFKLASSIFLTVLVGESLMMRLLDGIMMGIESVVLFVAIFLLSKKDVAEWFKACKAYRLEQKNAKKQALHP